MSPNSARVSADEKRLRVYFMGLFHMAYEQNLHALLEGLHRSADLLLGFGVQHRRVVREEHHDLAEQHGHGPAHYAAVLADGTVFELYPATADRETGALRLGFTIPSADTTAKPPLAPCNSRAPTGVSMVKALSSPGLQFSTGLSGAVAVVAGNQ